MKIPKLGELKSKELKERLCLRRYEVILRTRGYLCCDVFMNIGRISKSFSGIRATLVLKYVYLVERYAYRHMWSL